jgi:LPS export ABC transporter protein LptC
MKHKKIFLTFTFLFLSCASLAAAEVKEVKSQAVKSKAAAQGSGESDQQVGDFSLSGFGEKGKKSWDIAGQSAEVFSEVVKLKKVVGNNYAPNDTINLTADQGDFNKNSGVVHLQDNVVITTASGTKLTTDTLDWDRKQQVVSTLDKVNLARQDMNLSGQGAQGQTALKQIMVQKDVRLDIQALDKQANKKEKIVITCDGPLDVDYEKNIAIFNNNVKVEKPDLTIFSDKMLVYFIPKQKTNASDQGSAVVSSAIDKIVASGNVRIIRGENISYSQEATYTAAGKKISLTGNPQIVIYQSENTDEAFGN